MKRKIGKNMKFFQTVRENPQSQDTVFDSTAVINKKFDKIFLLS